MALIPGVVLSQHVFSSDKTIRLVERHKEGKGDRTYKISAGVRLK